MSATPPGFEIAVHQSLTQPILLGGAPRILAIINGTLGAAIGLGLQMWPVGLALFVLGHSLAVMAARYDPDCVEAMLRHLRQKGYLSC